MKKVVLSIIMFGISIALLVGVIIPIAQKAGGTGDAAYDRQVEIDTAIQGLSTTIKEGTASGG